MASSYLIYPSLEERIQTSGLLERFPELGNRSSIGYIQVGDLESEVISNDFNLPIIVVNRVFRVLEDPQEWKIQRKSGDNDIFGNPSFIDSHRIEADVRDLALGTGYILPNIYGDEKYNEGPEFDIGEGDNFQKYGFSSKLEMIMSLSAYRCREVIKRKIDEYEWVNSKGIRNVITACEHGDPKFFQYSESLADRVISPFGNEVLFQPRLKVGGMTHVYHSHEPEFFATFFRYAIELGVLDEIMGENGENFLKGSHNLPGYLGPYGDAGSGGYEDFSSFLFRVNIPIGGQEGRYRNAHTHTFAPSIGDGYIEFKIGDNKELQLFDNSGNFIMQFLPEDVEYLLKGVLHQCANGHGRTSKHQILELVKYYYSSQFQEQKKDANL